jgi:hypothetical protein
VVGLRIPSPPAVLITFREAGRYPLMAPYSQGS